MTLAVENYINYAKICFRQVTKYVRSRRLWAYSAWKME